MLCYGVVPQRSTYYTEREEQAIEHIADRNDDSFSGVVRAAVQETYDIEAVMENE